MKSSKSRKSRTNDNLKEEPVKKISSELTVPDAEIMFTIWKKGYAITNADIREAHFQYFRPRRRKDEDTIRGIISDIHRLEKLYERNYLLSRGKPKKHRIAQNPLRHPKPTVHSQATAIMLLELSNGFFQQQRRKEILRAEFENYLANKYAQPEIEVNERPFKDAADITDRLEIAAKSDYVRFIKYGRVAGVEPAERLNDDFEYLLLIVNDYARDLRDDPKAKKEFLNLQKVLAACGRPDSVNPKDAKGAKA